MSWRSLPPLRWPDIVRGVSRGNDAAPKSVNEVVGAGSEIVCHQQLRQHWGHSERLIAIHATSLIGEPPIDL
jgi:hypothetical protein